jgi:hypothetical protein
LFQMEYWLQYTRGNPSRSFRELYIEPVSYCNLRCRWCALDHSKSKKRLDVDIFREALNQIVFDERLQYLRWIHLHNGGESTLHPNIVEMLSLVEKAKEKALEHGRRFPKVSLLTNGTVGRWDLLQALKETRAIDVLRISMDGGSPQQYEYIRGRASWGDFSKTARELIAAVRTNPNAVRVEFISLIEDDQLPGALRKNREFADLLGLADDYEVRYNHGWGGQLEDEPKRLPNPLPWYQRGCRLLLHSLVLLADGYVTVCCADLNGRGVIGRFPQERLVDIYMKAKRQWMLKKVSEGKNAEVPLCASCEGF